MKSLWQGTQVQKSFFVMTACLISFSLLEFVPGLGITSISTFFLTTSPRPTPFVKRTGELKISHQFDFQFIFEDGTESKMSWPEFRAWRQDFAYPHHALLGLYKPLIYAPIINPSILIGVLYRTFCKPGPYLDQFHLSGKIQKVIFSFGKIDEEQRISFEAQCQK